MYLDSNDFQTVWRLAHNWVGANPDKSDPNALSAELKEAIHRLMSAAISRAISIRTRRMIFFEDDSFFSLFFDFRHLKNFRKCLRGGEFNKAYLDSIYIKRGEVLRWCQNEFLTPPPIWKLELITGGANDESDDETAQWHKRLTDRQRRVITCLEIAKRIWKDNPALFYEDVYNHPDMIHQDKPRTFTLDSFKKWTRELAPEAAKAAGRRKESK